MGNRRARFYGAMFAGLLLGGASGCGATVWIKTSGSTTMPGAIGTARARAAAADEQTQTPGTCQVPPPQIHMPNGEWTATKTILSTDAIDICKGERQVRPMDFRRRCEAGHCKTYLYTVDFMEKWSRTSRPLVTGDTWRSFGHRQSPAHTGPEKTPERIRPTKRSRSGGRQINRPSKGWAGTIKWAPAVVVRPKLRATK